MLEEKEDICFNSNVDYCLDEDDEEVEPTRDRVGENLDGLSESVRRERKRDRTLRQKPGESSSGSGTESGMLDSRAVEADSESSLA